jgi:GNAT superfamily N-acetyltransferase
LTRVLLATRLARVTDTDFTLRPATSEDAQFLTEMLLEAANWRPGHEINREDVLGEPEVAHYVAGWPRPDDFGVVAVDQHGQPIGAVWLRYFSADNPGYGFVSPDIPELGIAVVASWRGRGVGRALLRKAAQLASERGVARVSLSVERANPAAKLYASEGYVTVQSGSGSDTMIKTMAARQ